MTKFSLEKEYERKKVMNKKQVAITLGGMCFILTCAIVIQLNTMNDAASIVGTTATENNLRDEVLRWKEKYDNAFRELEGAEIELELQREKASSNTTEATNLEEELKKANILLGLTEVTGNGVKVVLKDNSSVTAASIGALDNISYYLVHDEDLMIVINELKNAGAEAISINEHRIVSNTAITCDGNVILINGEKIGSPFTILAIGYPERLLGALLRPGGYIEQLNETGIPTEVTIVNKMKIPKYTGVLNSKYMQNVK